MIPTELSIIKISINYNVIRKDFDDCLIFFRNNG